MYIRCCGNVFTWQLPSNDTRIHIQTQNLKGELYEVRRWDGFSCHDIHAKFRKDRFRHSKVYRGIVGHTDSMVIT
jgi:hypothetical protein